MGQRHFANLGRDMLLLLGQNVGAGVEKKKKAGGVGYHGLRKSGSKIKTKSGGGDQIREGVPLWIFNGTALRVDWTYFVLDRG